MEIKVITAGKCMICGKPIKLVVPRGYGKLPNIFFCKKCEPELEYDKKRPESEDKEQDPKYCDRNICVSNEYNSIGCDECEVTKSQEPWESEEE